MQKRIWESENGKWAVEFMGEINPTEENGVYQLLAADNVNPHLAIIDVTVIATVTGVKLVKITIEASRKLPAYVTTKIKAMVMQARWIGLEPAEEVDHGSEPSDDVEQYAPITFVIHPKGVHPSVALEITAASEVDAVRIAEEHHKIQGVRNIERKA